MPIATLSPPESGLCEQGGGPGLSLPIPLFPPVPLSLISCMVSVDVKHRERRSLSVRAQELCEHGGGPGLSFPIPCCCVA